MMKRESTTYSIAWFADQLRAKRLDLNPPYQRLDLVWGKDYQSFFIDTILRNYPSPAIFLHVETFADGRTVYHVVDGKQRLTAIFQFVSGEFTVPKEYGQPEYACKEFADLSSEVKTAFWEYSIPIQQVLGASGEELRAAFDRLNRNVARLSKQELETVTHWGQAPERQRQATGGPILGRVG